MSYFTNFPIVYYTLDDRKSVNLIQDILRRIVIDQKVLENTLIFDEYDMVEGETLEMVADKFYKDPNMYWVIALTNDILDPRFDTILGYNEFEKFIKSKYPSNVFLTANVANSFYLNEVITGQTSGATAKVYSNITLSSNLQYINLNGAFEAGEDIQGYLSKANATITSNNPHVVDSRFNTHHYENGNGIIVTYATYASSTVATKKEVTNYDYEVNLQSEKRRLKILKPEYASIIVTEFDKKIAS
jgi:hypothetical protein